MKARNRILSARFTAFGWTAALLCAATACSQTAPTPPLAIHWDKVLTISKSTPTLQVVVNPMTAPGSPIHDGTFQSLKDLGADYVRYVPWLPYPLWAVAEITAPTKEKTSWNFTAIDPMTCLLYTSDAADE